jgi:Trypsin-like peptidase domain
MFRKDSMLKLVTMATGAPLLISIALLSAGCAATGLTPAEKMMWSTYLVASPNGIATCVIVNRKDPSAPDGIVPVLVTSAHVLAVAPHGPFYLAYRSSQPGQSPQVDILEIDPPEETDPAFIRHPRHDVAALEIRLPADLANEVTLPSFLDESAIAPRENEPHPGEDVSVLGFPRVFPGTEGAFPVLRSGRIASYSAGPPSDRETFLVNTNIYSGDSGGPVFTSRRGKPKLVGIMTERIGKKEGSVPLGVAINASVIAETLRLEAADPRARLDGDAENPAVARNKSEAGSVKLLGPAKSLREILRSKGKPSFPIPLSAAPR